MIAEVVEVVLAPRVLVELVTITRLHRFDQEINAFSLE